MDREAIVTRKASEIQEHLAAWFLREGLLEPGEEVLFSLKIRSTGNVVKRDPEDFAGEPRPLEISASAKTKFKGEFLRPAQLDAEEIQEILNHVPRGYAHDQLKELLVKNNNNPTRCFGVAQNAGNRFLKEPLRGKRYRFASNRNIVQLWEVKHEE